jgi:thiamine biosynthesis protein ThiI
MAEESGGVAVALFSGGIDSPVAVARMLSVGWRLIPLHCSQEPIVGPEAEAKALTILTHLKNCSGLNGSIRYPLEGTLYVVPVAAALGGFTSNAAHRDYFVHMKRLFNRLGCLLAAEVGATHILTGENMGQVSSQTLGNLGAVEEASELPILRPLLGFDKQEIIDQARVWGTFDISTGPEVCDALGPAHPTTVADIHRLEENEQLLGGLNSVAAECYLNRRLESF